MPPDGNTRALEITAAFYDRRDELTKLQNYEALIAPFRIQLREFAREKGISLLEALAHVFRMQQPGKLDISIWSAACLDCIEAGEATPRPGDAPKAEKASGKVPGWAKSLCRGGTRLVVPSTDASIGGLRRILVAGAFHVSPVVEERVSGFCDVDFAHDLAFEDADRWMFGDILVVGWRVDERKVGSGLLKSETEAACRRWMKEEGKPWCPADVRREIKADVKADLLRKSLPLRRIFPVVWHLQESWILVQGNKKAVADVVAFLKEELGRVDSWSPTEVLHSGVRLALGMLYEQCTDLRQPSAVPVPKVDVADGEDVGDLEAGALNDFLLWLAIFGHEQGVVDVDGRQIEWSLDGPAVLAVPKPEKGIVRVELSGTEQGVFHAALAEGAHLLQLRLMVCETWKPTEADGGPTREQFHLTLDREEGGLDVSALGSPALPSAGAEEGATEAEVYARVETYQRLIALLQILIRAYAEARMERWADVIQSGRRWVGLELQRRYAFDAETGQGWLFDPADTRSTAESIAALKAHWGTVGMA